MSKISYDENTDSVVFSFDKNQSFNLFLAPISFEEIKASNTISTIAVHCSDKQCNQVQCNQVKCSNVQCNQVQCSQVLCSQYRQCVYVYRYYTDCDCYCNCDCTCGDSDTDG